MAPGAGISTEPRLWCGELGCAGQSREHSSMGKKPVRTSGTKAGVGGNWATLTPQGAGPPTEKPPTRTRGSRWHFLHQHQSPGSLWKSSACPEPHPVEALPGTGKGPETPGARPGLPRSLWKGCGDGLCCRDPGSW